DAFISRRFRRFEDLPHGARVGTSSPRRQAQLRHARPDLKLELLRGNARKLAKPHAAADIVTECERLWTWRS
ncbi:MAG: hypothetical protein ACO27L_08020, partial [Schleiferiaceae bacterium]